MNSRVTAAELAACRALFGDVEVDDSMRVKRDNQAGRNADNALAAGRARAVEAAVQRSIRWLRGLPPGAKVNARWFATALEEALAAERPVRVEEVP